MAFRYRHGWIPLNPGVKAAEKRRSKGRAFKRVGGSTALGVNAREQQAEERLGKQRRPSHGRIKPKANVKSVKQAKRSRRKRSRR